MSTMSAPPPRNPEQSKPKPGTIDWYLFWLQHGCIEFYDDGKPKVFNADYSDHWPGDGCVGSKPDDPGLHSLLDTP
jgi:hypothetical protein